jgi:hypothetical protein
MPRARQGVALTEFELGLASCAQAGFQRQGMMAQRDDGLTNTVDQIEAHGAIGQPVDEKHCVVRQGSDDGFGGGLVVGRWRRIAAGHLHMCDINAMRWQARQNAPVIAVAARR